MGQAPLSRPAAGPGPAVRRYFPAAPWSIVVANGFCLMNRAGLVQIGRAHV